jgi:membrane fusion protein, macrolide-specific efflux system
VRENDAPAFPPAGHIISEGIIMSQKSRFFLKSFIILEVLLVSFLMLGCNFLPAEEEELEPPLIEPQKIEYKTEAVKRGTLIQQISMTGSFASSTQETLIFELSGRLKSKEFSAGAAVKVGDLILRLDTSDLEYQITIQEIEIQKTELGIKQMRKLGASSYDLQIAQLNLKEQQLQMDHLQTQLASAQAVAPIDGILTYVTSTSIGDYISAYQIVAKVADPTSMVLITKGDDASDLPIGAEVTVKFQNEEYAGKVVANPSTLFDDPDENLHDAAIIQLAKIPEDAELGSSASIKYIQNIHENVIVLDRRNVNLMSGRYFVNCLVDGIRVEKDVEIGLMTATEVEIVKGLEEGDLVIID